MTGGGKIRPAIRNLVRTRARGLCEYCHTSERWQYIPFTIDHIIPLSRGGTDELDNLALSCFHCNRKKGDRTQAVDPLSGDDVALYHPRTNAWQDHFVWVGEGLYIKGVTSIGRATVGKLDLNRDRIVNIRAADKEVGRHPPVEDVVSKTE